MEGVDVEGMNPTGVNERESDREDEGTTERDAADPGRMGLPEGEAHEPRVWPNPSSVEPPSGAGLEERRTRRGQPDRAESLPTRSRGEIRSEAGSDGSHEDDPRAPSGPAEQMRTPAIEGSSFAFRPESEPAAWRRSETVAMARDYPAANDARGRWPQPADSHVDSEATEEPLEREEVDERQRARRPDGPSQAGRGTQRHPTLAWREGAHDERLRGIRR